MENCLIMGDQTIYYQSMEDIMKSLLGEDYFSLDEKEKMNRRYQNATLLTLETKLKVQTSYEPFTIDSCILIDTDETLIYSLLFHKIIIILEQKDANILPASIDKSQLPGNYLNMNCFAKSELLKRLIKKEGSKWKQF